MASKNQPADASQAPVAHPRNALSRGFGLLGDEWSLILLRLALQGQTKYSEFQESLPISHAVLTNRLDTLVREGLIDKRLYSERPPRSEYLLTEKGRSTWPILVAIWGWERTWVATHTYETPPMIHAACSSSFSPVVTCQACNQPTSAQDLDSRLAPGRTWRESVPETTTRRRSEARGGRAAHSFYPDTMAAFGNRWSAAILGAAFLGVKRFSDFHSLLGVPQGLLADRLSSLCEHSILTQVQTAERADWAEYQLSAKGLGLFPVVATTIDWSEHWMGTPGARVVEMTHQTCGHDFHSVIACDQCHQPLQGNAIRIGTAT